MKSNKIRAVRIDNMLHAIVHCATNNIIICETFMFTTHHQEHKGTEHLPNGKKVVKMFISFNLHHFSFSSFLVVP